MKTINREMEKAGIIHGKLTPAECVANMLLSGNPRFVAEGEKAIAGAYPQFKSQVQAAMDRATKQSQ